MGQLLQGWPERRVAELGDHGFRNPDHLGLVVLDRVPAPAACEPAARAWYAESLARGRALGDPRGLGQALCNVGRLALREGDTSTAGAALEEALLLFRDIGDRRNTALALEGLGRIAAWSDPACQPAHNLFTESLALFQESDDMPGVAACLAGLANSPLRRAGRTLSLDQTLATDTASSVAPPHRPGNLTDRELEVVQLLAAGTTNRDIAAALVIAPSTVERHVTNVLNRRGLRTRGQVAVWAVTHGVVLGTATSTN